MKMLAFVCNRISYNFFLQIDLYDYFMNTNDFKAAVVSYKWQEHTGTFPWNLMEARDEVFLKCMAGFFQGVNPQYEQLKGDFLQYSIQVHGIH